MARRKATTSSTSSDKPTANRTAIVVALIGLLGTLGAALIGVLGQRAAQPSASLTPPNGQTVPDSTLPATSTGLTAGADRADCLTQWMADVEPAFRTAMFVGDSQQDIYFPTQALTTENVLGPFGLTLLAQGQVVAGVKFIFAPADQVFEVTSAVDGACQAVTQLTNLTRPNSGQVIQNWDALGLGLPGRMISLRIGLNGPDHFRLSARASQ